MFGWDSSWNTGQQRKIQGHRSGGSPRDASAPPSQAISILNASPKFFSPKFTILLQLFDKKFGIGKIMEQAEERGREKVTVG